VAVDNIVFETNGYVTITKDGRKTTSPVLVRLAQVVMALLRLLMEQGNMGDTTLKSEGIEGVTLQELLDTLIDRYGAEYENESQVH